MTIKEDFYEIVKLHRKDEIHEKISDGITVYLKSFGFDTDVSSFNINIEMHVDSDRIKEL